MKIIFYSVIFAVSLSISALAQTPTPSPTPVSKESDVVKISTNLVQVDVTVTDLRGNIINDIKPEEMEIYENGKKQPISNFSFVSDVNRTSDRVKNTPEKVGAPLPPVVLRPEQVHRTVALVIDDLSLSAESIYLVRQALKKFVDVQMQEGDLVAIVRVGAGIGALQQFTSDKRLLYAAIEKVQWNAVGRGEIGAFTSLEAKMPNLLDVSNNTPKGGENSLQQMLAEEDMIKSYRNGLFAVGTFGALNYVVRGMQSLPGRKSVMLLSDGFKLYIKEPPDFIDYERIPTAIRFLSDAANRAGVVINTMDVRGLQTADLTAADNTSGRNATEMNQEGYDRSHDLSDTQDGLIYLAKQTGGRAVINTNDLSGEIRKTLDDRSYYLVGFQPDDETFDPAKARYNNLEVKVKRKDVKVRYRSGFYGVTDESLASVPTKVTTSQKEMMNALMSPFSVNDISLHLNVIFGNDAKEGSYIKPLVHIDGKDLKFTTEPDGSKKAVFNVVGVIFGDNGEVVDQISKTYTFAPKPDDYQKVLEKGFVYSLIFPIKKPGAYQFRIAVSDSQTNKIGSAGQFIEIPNLKKNNLILSSIVLDNIAADDLKNTTKDNSLADASLRRFKKGTILRYGLEIYNAPLDQAKKVQLQSWVRIFRDGKMILNGTPKPLDLNGQMNLQRLNFGGALELGAGIQPGDYVLQIIMIDNSAAEKRKYSTQWIQFEVTE